MGLAIDTVLGSVTNDAALTAVTLATGDSATVRSFAPGSSALLETIVRKGGTAGSVQVRSPMFHDDVRGIQFTTSESPAAFLLPASVGQRLVSQDTLTIEANSGAADSTVVGLCAYYSNLAGSSARLHSWGDIGGNIRSIKPIEVDLTTSATIGAWSDTVITTTENLLHANTDYAVLGFVSNVALALVGIRGQETGNLRVCGPGASSTLDVSEYFIYMSNRHGTPHIPVFNSANKDSVYVSAADNAASTAAKVQLVLAELATNLAT